MYTTLTASAYLGENANAEWELYQQELTWNEKKKEKQQEKIQAMMLQPQL